MLAYLGVPPKDVAAGERVSHVKGLSACYQVVWQNGRLTSSRILCRTVAKGRLIQYLCKSRVFSQDNGSLHLRQDT